ncbi:MAG: DUF1611 domain-containing protein [Prochloraceae cyanobacterium]
MRLTAAHKIVILLHEGIRNREGKTGLGFLRYGEAPVVALLGKQCAGQSLFELTGIEKDLPIAASLKETLSYNPNVLLIGLAPSGGRLPDTWWQEVKQAVDMGLSLVNGLHTAMAPLFLHLQPGHWS